MEPKPAASWPLWALLVMKSSLPLAVHPVKSPVSKPPLITRFDKVGGGGAVGASTVTAKTADAALVPFASVSVAVKLCGPTVSPLAGKLQSPLAFTEAWPTDVVPSNTLTVLLASPVPVNVIEVAVVRPSLTGAVSGENKAMTGGAGGVGGGGGGAEPGGGWIKLIKSTGPEFVSATVITG